MNPFAAATESGDMATDSAETTLPGVGSADADHVRGIVVTGVASLAGVAAALASTQLTADIAAPADAALATGPKIALAAAILVQFPLFRLLGYDLDEFSTKDYLFVAFMTFSLWFVTWGIILSSGAAG
jgi:hypothetical protein